MVLLNGDGEDEHSESSAETEGTCAESSIATDRQETEEEGQHEVEGPQEASKDEEKEEAKVSGVDRLPYIATSLLRRRGPLGNLHLSHFSGGISAA